MLRSGVSEVPCIKSDPSHIAVLPPPASADQAPVVKETSNCAVYAGGILPSFTSECLSLLLYKSHETDMKLQIDVTWFAPEKCGSNKLFRVHCSP